MRKRVVKRNRRKNLARTNMKKEKKIQERVADSYASFLTRHPFIILIIAVMFTIIAAYYSGLVENESMGYDNMLPDSIPVIHASNVFSDNFGTVDNVNFAIEIDPYVAGSNEPRDVRELVVLEYIDQLEDYISSSNQVSDTNSAVKILKMMNDGHLPKDVQQVKALMEKNGLLSGYISEDGTTALISISLEENYDSRELVDDMTEALQAVKTPAGISAKASGDAVAEVTVIDMMSNDMATTSQISMFGIILIMLLSFWSIRYGLMPLTTIIIGVVWTMGFIGLLGLGMNTATSGVISMIMGIGIDFGIQVVNRFRQEYTASRDIDVSMRITLENVMFPMFITTLAAIIGFKAMSMGQLTILADMGNMMMYGVVFCFLVAVTVVPVIVIYSERIYGKIHKVKKRIIARI
ncbi:MAG: MMPL family transporter [Candidatus Woesearchaeota archaeon]